MVWVAVLMSDSFARVGQLAGVVVGLILGQVEIRILERRPKWGQLDQGDVVSGSGSPDRSRTAGEGLGQVGLLHGPDPDTRGGVAVDELIGAGVGDDAAPADHDQVI